MAQRYLVGIDLGTTNTVVAYAEAGDKQIQLFEIDQLTAPGEVAARALLPSLRYHADAAELAAGALDLPWPQAENHTVIGSLARKLGAQVPGRLVASAKSWLSHAAVDRMAPILPWGAASDIAKISPVAASASYLAYVRAAWNWRFPDHPLEQQELVLTVPASFDEGARALTVEAARHAGLPDFRLLEEPQAAFYDWLFRHRKTLDTELAQTRLVLICDVGGGTTDLSLIQVEPGTAEDNQPQLTRIGVGDHLMLGGDNMDMALAHLVESRLTDKKRLSPTDWLQLIERCRSVKEMLLAADAPERASVTLLGTGARLIGSARTVELTREEVQRLIVDGFFPIVAATEQPNRRRSGIVEFGLPYASDPAITRHIAGFLAQHAKAGWPDTILFNGGVFRADALSSRLCDTLKTWSSNALRQLENDNPDVAVARGAVAYAMAQHGYAPKIGGGSARSYFLVLDDHNRKEKDQQKERHGICILPRGSDTGQEILLAGRSFALRLGQPVRFNLVSATSDHDDIPPQAGDIVSLDRQDLMPLPPIATVLKSAEAKTPHDIPVQLSTALTEVGTLEMYCINSESKERWLLEFQLRENNATSDPANDTATAEKMPPNLAQAINRIERIFGPRAQQVSAKEVRQLRVQLEQLLGKRELWHTTLLRRLFDTLWQYARGRRRSADHERQWLNLSGYCLRPGFGDVLDEWRIEQLWSIFEPGVQYRKDSQVCSAWWTLWRRVAGGLDQAAQQRILEDFAFNLQDAESRLPDRPATLVNGNVDDMLRVGASLERIPVEHKTEIGNWLLGRIQTSTATPRQADNMVARELWALARIGARQPFYGNVHDVVPIEVTENWLETIITLDWKRIDATAFAATHLARLSGDRTRDISDALREKVIRNLKAVNAPAIWISLVSEVVQLDEANTNQVLGESLPPGLKLLS